MENLRVLEDGLIPIYQNEMGRQLVDARELYAFVESKQDFSEWIKKRLGECEAVEGQDFSIILGKSTGGRPQKDYILLIDIAKEVAMLERNEKGKAVRKYFISVERKYKEKVLELNKLSPQLQMFKSLFDTVAAQQLEQKRIEEEVVSTKEELAAVREVICINPEESWREDTNRLISKICKKVNNYQLPKEEAYKALEQRAKCDLKRRLVNMRARLILNGSSKSKASSLNYLDVISEDIKLKEIYIVIIKELSIKYGIKN